MSPRIFILSKITLSVMGALSMTTLLTTAQAKPINPALFPAPDIYPHEIPRPMLPKPSRIDSDIQDTVREALQEPAQSIASFIPSSVMIV